MNIKKLSAALIAAAMLLPSFGAYADDDDVEYDGDSELVLSGWYQSPEDGSRSYYSDGQPVSGLYEINGKYYLFSESGILLTDTWYETDEAKYYFGSSGRTLTGRQIIDGEEYTFDKTGAYLCQHKNSDYVKLSDNIYTYDEMTEDITRLAKRYPDACSVSVIGTTADGRNIYDILLGNPYAEKQLVITASCHAREYMTSLLVMEQLEYCLNGLYTKDYKDISYKELFDNCAVHFIPMINPDGVTISQFGKDGINDEVLRSNVYEMYQNAVEWGYSTLSENDYYKRWKANALGVDLNRNFDGRWETVETLNGPVGWNYKGEYPESESESIAVTSLIRSLSNPVSVVSYHATGSVLWWDYGQTDEYREMCERQRDVVTKLTGYSAKTADLSSAAGLSDWIISEYYGSTVPETIEIGVNAAPLEASEYKNIRKKNIKIVPALAYLYYDTEE